jgi:hypothetical protein
VYATSAPQTPRNTQPAHSPYPSPKPHAQQSSGYKSTQSSYDTQQRTATASYKRKRSTSPARHGGKKPFRENAARGPLSVCSICLGRNPHRINQCTAPMLWDGSGPAARRNEGNHIIAADGTTLCSDWQRPGSCIRRDHDARHRCSGCDGAHEGGAQSCPRAQRI